MVEVVNLYAKDYKELPGDVYIGRAGHGKSGQFGNPFSIGKDGDRAEVISKFEDWLEQHPELVEQLQALNPKRLVCFCAPQACHGDVYRWRLD